MGIYLVMKNNMQRCFKNKVLFLLTIIFPIIIILFGSFMNQMNNTNMRVGLLLGNDDTLRIELEQVLNKSKGIEYQIASENSVNTDLITSKYHVVLDYRHTKDITEVKIISFMNRSNDSYVEVIEAISKGRPYQISELNENGTRGKERIVAFLLTLLMITSTINSTVLIKDKSNGTFRRYCLSPKTKITYGGGIVFYNIILTSFQVVIGLVFNELFGVTLGLTIIEFCIVLLLIVLISTVFGIFIVSICNSELKANIMASCITVLMSILGGSFVSIQYMPKLLQIISFVSPIRWIIDATKWMII